jgi:small GTP-binding protein
MRSISGNMVFRKRRPRGFMHSYWKSGPVKSGEEKKFVSERAKLLEKIREKTKKREERVSEGPESAAEGKYAEKEDIAELSKRLGYDVHEDISTSGRQRGAGKKELTKEEIEEKRKKALQDKEKLSGRQILTQRIKDLEDQISKTKYNKRTQHAIGLMKAQLADLKQKLQGGSGKKGIVDQGYAVRKSGDATVVLLGFPSTGKSTLLNNLTNAKSEVAAYAFTTLTVIPGLLEYKQAKIQILDVPGIVEGAAKGTGRGKEVLQVIRNADLILMLVDALKPQQKKLLEKEVLESNIRANAEKPDIKITKTSKDGIRIGRTVPTPELDDETIKGILNQFKIVNANVLIRDDVDADQFIDVVEGNKVYTPAIVVVNKADLLTDEQLENLKDYLKPDLCISAEKQEHLEELKELIYEKLRLIRLYLKEINKKPDMNEPMIMRHGSTMEDVCMRLHHDFIDKFKFARIWGRSVKFAGQKILRLDHRLEDGDVIEIHLK